MRSARLVWVPAHSLKVVGKLGEPVGLLVGHPDEARRRALAGGQQARLQAESEVRRMLNPDHATKAATIDRAVTLHVKRNFLADRCSNHEQSIQFRQ